VNKRAIIGGLIILVVLALAFYQGTGLGRKWQTIPIPTTDVIKTTVVPTIDLTKTMEEYKHPKLGYTVMKPVGWEVQEIADDVNFDNRIVFIPALNSGQGNIVEMSITLIRTPVNNQVLATSAEWNKWLSSPVGATDNSGFVSKKGEKMVEGNRAMVLWQDKDLPEGYTFSIMTWINKNGSNYYINALGAGNYGEYEARLFDLVVGSFKIGKS
jgi:hypothetical protein